MISTSLIELFFGTKKTVPKAEPSNVVKAACARMYTATNVYNGHIELSNNGKLYAFPYSSNGITGVILRCGTNKDCNLVLSKIDKAYVNSFYEVCLNTIERDKEVKRIAKEHQALAHINSALPEAYRKKLY